MARRESSKLMQLFGKGMNILFGGWVERHFDPFSPEADFGGSGADISAAPREICQASIHPQDVLLAVDRIGRTFHRWISDIQEETLRRRLVTLKSGDSYRLTYSVEHRPNEPEIFSLSGRYEGTALQVELRGTAESVAAARKALADLAISLGEVRRAGA